MGVWVVGEPVPPSESFGLGHMVRRAAGVEIVGHTGLGMGWNASLQLIPATGDGFVVLTNGDNGSYIHQMLTCAWFRDVRGEDLAECRSASGKRLNRLSAYTEWLFESGTIPEEIGRKLLAILEGTRGSIGDRDVDAVRGRIDSYRTELAALSRAGRLPEARMVELSRHATALLEWVELF